MYKFIKNKVKNQFIIVEVATNKIVHDSNNLPRAEKHYKFLKSGGSWAGWSPDFIEKRIYQKNA